MLDHTGEVFGKYRLKKLLGKGGFAEVYLGEHIYLHTLAAVKILQGYKDQEQIQQFFCEAMTTAQLKNRNIIRVLDYDAKWEPPFIIEEYASRGNLRQLHPDGTHLPLETVISYAKQIGSALHAAHVTGIIHRDVKPENILINATGELLLADFGIATLRHSTVSIKTVGCIGTPNYMAPEQIQGKPCPESDQYSLGIMVYEWLCGERPFTAGGIGVLNEHLNSPIPPLKGREVEISSAVEAVVLKALEKDPKRRFTNTVAFTDALEQAKDGTLSVDSIISPIDVRRIGKLRCPFTEKKYALLVDVETEEIPMVNTLGDLQYYSFSDHRIISIDQQKIKKFDQINHMALLN